ncbi:hypothetical protein ACGFZP_20050 [Kitasatospora sp. NPDC048239]|uniref:hypothetical protein n=1 Tax=Kitasatospora sp. NPDC048239 TaxID=3364046 RepID=UPI00371C6481
MEIPELPDRDVLLERLIRSPVAGLRQGDGGPAGQLESLLEGQPPAKEFLGQLADRTGLRRDDLFLVAGLPLEGEALSFDERSGRELPRLVQSALALPAVHRQRVRDHARSLSGVPRTYSPRKERAYEQYPPGVGSLLVRMLALRNLRLVSAAQVMAYMSGVYVAGATIGSVGHGTRQLDAELLTGFAAVLGVPFGTLEALTGIHRPPGSLRDLPPEVADTAALLWDVRHLGVEQVLEVLALAKSFGLD